MPRLYQSIAGAILGFAALAARPSIAPAQEFRAPTYSRARSGADDWHARGGGHGYGRGRYGFGYGDNFFQPYYSPVIAGYWYQRPYPYHFDYYRHRWGGGPELQGDMTPIPSDCPCAEAVSDATPTVTATDSP